MSEAELRAEIVERPDDDELRLVYADYLEERGAAPTADLIRAQLELAATDRGDPRWWSLQAVAVRALWAHQQSERGAASHTFGTRRGLIGELVMPVDVFVESGPALCREHPIEALHLTGDTAERAGELLEMPEVRRLRELRLEGLPASLVWRLVSSGRFARLHTLEIRACRLGHDGGMALLSVLPPGLEVLELSSAGIASDVAVAASRLPLRELGMSGDQLGDPRLDLSPTLRRLTFDGNSVNGDLHNIFRNTSTAGLVELGVASNGIGDASLGLFVQQCDLRSLERLDLRANRQDPGSVLGLRMLGLLEQLVELDLSDNELGDQGTFELIAAREPRLRFLDVSDNQLTDAGLDALLAAPVIDQLVYLGVDNYGISDRCLARLLEPDLAPALAWLDFGMSRPDALRRQLEERFIAYPYYARGRRFDD